MDNKIKLLAACSVAALTTVACAPSAGPYMPHSDTVYTGGTNTPVAHSHSGKVHSHKLPATGIRHTHNMGGSNAQTQTQTPAGNYNGGTTHSHSGRTHSHKLPASGLNHTHRIGANGSAAQNQQVPQTNYTPPTNNQNQRRCWHGRNTRGECNPAPQQNTQTQNTYRPPATNNQGQKRCWHGRNSRGECNPAPQNNSKTQPQTNNSGASYYDNAANNAANNYVPPTNNNSYYDYSDQGSSSTYYDNARPKGSGYYNYQPKPTNTNTGSFAPESHSGSNVYVVKRGDTVFQVMRNTGVYWKDIIRLNNLQAPNYQINPGQRLRLR